MDFAKKVRKSQGKALSFAGTLLASLVAQKIKNPPAMQKTWVQSLGWEDPLEEDTATHPSILAWRIPWTEEPGGLQSTGRTESGLTEATLQQQAGREAGIASLLQVTVTETPSLLSRSPHFCERGRQ